MRKYLENAASVIKELLINVVGGLIVLLLPTLFSSIDSSIILGIQILLWFFLILFNVHYFMKGKRLRVVKSTVNGEGGTEDLLIKVRQYRGLKFMGVGAGRWVQAKNFDAIMRNLISKHIKVRLILLNPNSEEAQIFDASNKKEGEQSVKEKIIDSIKVFNKYKKENLNIEIKVYSHMPVFRIAIIGKSRMYVGAYNVNRDDLTNDIPQMVLEENSNDFENMLFNSFIDYFNTEWNEDSLKEIEFDKIDEEGKYFDTL